MRKKSLGLLFVLGLFAVIAAVNGAECSKGTVACRSGEPECIPGEKLRDGHIDCRDGSDEGCEAGGFVCADRSGCIEQAKYQDGVPDCKDASDEECGPLQHRCVCAPHRCIDAENLKDGIKDCADGSDEVEVIHSKSECSKVNATVVRQKRRASDVSTRVDGPVTTSMFLEAQHSLEARTRPTGLLTSTIGTFIQQGTTTEFATKVFGTHVDGHYAKIISTSSRVFFAIPSPAAGDALQHRPTGLISSVTATKIHGQATTLHTTDYYRTYIDGTYAQLVSSYSRVVYPSTQTILATQAYNSIHSGHVYQTAVNNDQNRHVIDVSPINSKPIERIVASKASSVVKATGGFRPFDDSKYAPSAVQEDVITVTGTHGAFVNAPVGNEETTYNLLTGTYVRDSKTYLFFFGNSALSPSSTVNVVQATSVPEPQELIIKSSGGAGKRIVVNVDKELNLVVPKLSHAVAGTGEIDGNDMGGVFIEGSEDVSGFSVQGAHRSRINVATEMLTITIGKNIAHTKILRDQNIQPTSVKPNDRTVLKFVPLKERLRQSSRVTSSTSHYVEEENENLLKARKIENSFKPSKPKVNLPTYTVGHDLEYGSTAPNEDTTEIIVSVNKSVEAFVGGRPKNFKFVSTGRSRTNKSFRNNFHTIHDKEDLQHVESQMATVTYVGFSDFTTTVGNTVIVFMPHTKPSSQQPKSVGPNLKVTTLSDVILPTISNKLPTDTTRMMTKVKTYFSNSPGMVTKTVTGHTLNMQTTLPTMVVTPASRREKELDLESKIEASVSDYEDLKSKVLAEEHVDASHVVDEEISSEFMGIEPSVTFDEASSELIASSMELEPSSAITIEEVSSVQPELSSMTPTLPSKFATSSTLLYNTVDHHPIGLVKSIGGTEAFNGTTTLFTSLFYGTRIDGKYAQIIQTTSSIFYRPASEIIDASKSDDTTVKMTVTTEESVQSTTEASTEGTTEGAALEQPSTTSTDSSAENELENEVDLGRKVNSQPQDQVIDDSPIVSSINNNESVTVPVVETTTSSIQYVTKVIPNTVYKTFTYFTTFFIPDGAETSTSVISREVTSSDIQLSTSLVDIREILATAVQQQLLQQQQATTVPYSVSVETTTTEASTDTTNVTPETSQDTTLNEIVTSPTSPLPDIDQEEIELLFKTQYTTYTYLTTFFHDTSSSVSSREEVVTNIITSTLEPGAAASDPAVAGLFAREDSIISEPPSSVGVGRPTTKFFSSMDEKELFPTARLAPSEIEPFTIQDQPEGEKTYYTTYTYFTTIFVDGVTTVSSRTEVYTNVISASAIESTPTETAAIEATKTLQNVKLVPSIDNADDVTVKSPKAINNNDYANKYSTAIRSKPHKEEEAPESTTEREKITSPDLLTSSSDVLTTAEISEVTTEASTAQASKEASNNVVTEQIPSAPSGPTGPSGLEDQISLESNTDIDPSPTLLLQTSYTTFTYFTTLYKGTISEIISRLETMTNVNTETVSPKSVLVTPAGSVESNELDAASVQELYPITYFTTFTYWTTAYRDGSTVVTSREETVSNVITPTSEESKPTVSVTEAPSSVVVTPTAVEAAQQTTFYTTYTYFTTSYVGESTVINSRLETVTNIVAGSPEENTISPAQTGRAIGTVAPKDQLIEAKSSEVVFASPVLLQTGLISTIKTSNVNDGTTTLLSTDVYGTYIDGLYAKVLESTTKIITETIPVSLVVPVQPTGVVSLNVGSIVDADGVTTTFFTTKAIGTYIGDLYAQVVESTTSLQIDPDRTPEPPVASRTGLVRLIEGSIVKNDVTTVYESRVIGTIVDGKYAQVIESTSTYQTGINPSATVPSSVEATKLVSSSTPQLESSIGDTTEHEEHEEEGDEGDEGDEDDSSSGGKGRVKSRLTFSTRSRTFTPVIRPFVSRNRPTFAPRRTKTTSATTITRTTLTPTITATPANVGGGENSQSRGNRFNNRRVSSSSVPQASASPSSARKFSRGRSSSPGGFSPASSSGYISANRGRSSSGRIVATAASSYPFGSSSRRGGNVSGRSSFATINPSSRGSASQFSASSRFRIRPTSSLPFLVGRTSSVATTSSPDLNDNGLRDIDNDVTEVRTEDEARNTDFTDTTKDDTPTTVTEATSFKRPVGFRGRRPQLPTRAPTTTTTTTQRAVTRRLNLRRPSERNDDSEKKSTRPKFIATTTARAPITPRVPVSSRQRPTSSLFPPRKLFRRPGDDQENHEETKHDAEDEVASEVKHIEEEEVGDNDYEGSEVAVAKSVTESSAPKVVIRPFKILRRSRRQSEFGSRGTAPGRTLSARLRRPAGSSRKQAVIEEEEIVEDEPPVNTNSRYNNNGRSRASKTAQPASRVRPTAAQPRSQFTLTNSNNSPTRTNFRRPTSTQSTQSRRRSQEVETSRVSRPKAPRLRSQKDETTTSRGTGRRTNSATSRSRSGTTRSRYRNDFDLTDVSYSPSTFDGKITVTHQVPTEVTIPVVNGKITEYKQVIRNTPSTQVLGPNQYTSTEIDGKSVLIINTEVTATPSPGVTEITQFILRETPTTSVIFTPTHIRGRKTSFSHIVPSTVYEVEPVVNTLSDSLNPSAPLANLLLSQLLLGNFGLQQNINPLLGLNQPQVPTTPTTEYKTRTTTYVTTVTDLKSKELPITLRGKVITTTIIESSVDVITATEFITDTIVVTPTQNPSQQINSLLLPALLQAQLQQQQPQPNPLLQLQQAQLLQQQQKLLIKPDSKLHDELILDNTEKDDDRTIRDSEFDVISKEEISQVQKVPRPSMRKKPKPKPPPVEAKKETSIVTLYVSGRNPGEFSTVLSTVITDGASVVKREAITPPLAEILPSDVLNNAIPDSEIDLYVMSALNDIEGSELSSGAQETQSLESILGDVTKHMDPITSSGASASANPNSQTGHFLFQGSAELAPLKRKARSTNNRGIVEESQSSLDDQITQKQRIRVRIPVRRTKQQQKDLALSEAQHSGLRSDQSPSYNPLLENARFQEHVQDVIPVVSSISRKRIVITKRKKIENTEIIQSSVLSDNFASKSSRRRKVVTLRRPVSTIEASKVMSSTRNRIVITKKRPINKQSENLEINPSKNNLEFETQSETILKQDEDSTSNSVLKLSVFSSNVEDFNIEPSKIKSSPVNSKTPPFASELIKSIAVQNLSDFITSSKLESSFLNIEIPNSESSTPPITTSEIHVDESSIYDGPKYVRPTRFSVTRKPSDDFFRRIQSARTNAKIVLPSRRSNKHRSSPAYLSKLHPFSNSEVIEPTISATELIRSTNSISEFIEPSPSVSKLIQPTISENSSVVAVQSITQSYTTQTVTETKLKTFTYVVTRVSGDEQLVTTTVEIKPVVTTLTLTLPSPSATTAVPEILQSTPVSKEHKAEGANRDGRMNIEEARMNLATRVMNNGVEVIVADRSSNEMLRIAPSSLKPVILEPSTLTEQMLSQLPENEPQASLIKSLRADTTHLATRTLLTTYTHVSSQIKAGKTETSHREHVITNTIVGELIVPTKTASHVTVTEKPAFETSTLQTKYRYMNTILDGEVPIVVTSQETVENTLTGIFDLQPSVLETNTYYNTYTFTKTLSGEKGDKFTSKHRNIVTQVVVTDAPSIVLKSAKPSVRSTSTTDVVKTYFVTYTYFSTFLEKGSTVIKTNIATSSDVVTEKFYLSPKRTPVPESTRVSTDLDISPTSALEPLKVFATKTYLTTFTYFTTLLQGKSTVTSSSTKLVYNVVTEAITTGLDALYLDSLRSSFAAQTSREPITTTVMVEGEALEITAVQPTTTKDLMLSTALSPSFEHVVTGSTLIFLEDEPTTKAPSKVDHVITGTNTVFFPEVINNTDTPEHLLSSLANAGLSSTNQQSAFLTSTISATTVIPSMGGSTTLVPGDKVIMLTRPDGNVSIVPVTEPTKKRPTKDEDDDDDIEFDEDDLKVADLSAGGSGPVATEIGVNEFLNLGQFGLNSFGGIAPVLNAMESLTKILISTQNKTKAAPKPQKFVPAPLHPRPVQAVVPEPKNPQHKQPITSQREPVYIPVGGIANSAHSAHLLSEKHVPGFAESVRPDLPIEDNENAGSSWIDSLPIQGSVDERIPLMDRPPHSQIILGHRPTMESPLLQDGIPIQPGQVITANSDVIVGKPSVLGPRPRPGPAAPVSHGEGTVLTVHGHNLPLGDRRPPQGRPSDVVHHHNEIIHPPVLHQQHQHPKLPPSPKPSSNVAIGMRPPPPPPNNFNPTKVVSGVQTVFLGNQFPPQSPAYHHQNEKPIFPSHAQNYVDRTSATVRPSQPLIIDGNPQGSPYFGSDGPHDNSPVPLPETEPGFIGVSNFGVSDQHVTHYDNNEHIITGTIGEPPAGPQQLGDIILEIPDTMPVLQPGSNIQFPVHSEADGSSQFHNRPHFPEKLESGSQFHNQPHFPEKLESGSQFHNRPHFPEKLESGSQFSNRPQFEIHQQHQPSGYNDFEHINAGQGVTIHKPQFEVSGPVQQHTNRPPAPNVHGAQRPQYEKLPNIPPHMHHENNHANIPLHRPNIEVHRPQNEIYRPQNELHRPQNELHRPNNEVHRPQNELHRPQNELHRPQNEIHRPQNEVHRPTQNNNGEAFMRPPFVDNRPLRPKDQTIIDMRPPPLPPTQRPDDLNVHFVPPPPQQNQFHRPNIPLRPQFETPFDSQRHPGDILISPEATDDANEPVIQEGEKEGEQIAESENISLLPNEVPPEIVTERPSHPDFNIDDIVTERPFFRPDLPHRNRPNEPEIITKPPLVSFNNHGFVDNAEIVTVRPNSISTHNTIFVRPETETERPTLIHETQNIEFVPQGSTPRPFVLRPPWSTSSEKPLPVPDQDMNPPPPPPQQPNQDTVRFPVKETNLQDSTHRPTLVLRPKPPKPHQPYTYEIGEQVRPPPLPNLARPSPFTRRPVSDSKPSESTPGSVENLPDVSVTSRPRPSRPTIIRPPSRIRPKVPAAPQDTLEPPSPPPSVEPAVVEPSVKTDIVSLEGDNKFVRTKVEETIGIQPTKTVTVFETVRDSQRPRPTVIVSSRRRPFRPRPSISSSIDIEPSVEFWPEEVEVTPSHAFTSKIVQSSPAVRPTVLVAGFNRPPWPRPSSSVPRYETIERETSVRAELTTRLVTHTETLTVTLTETQVERIHGQPVTRTVILTQTEAPRTVVSTIVGTVTEIHTLDPSTITTTVSVVTREPEVHPTAKPPIYEVDNGYPAFTIVPVGSPPMRGDQRPDEPELGDEVELDTGDVDNTVQLNAPDRPLSVDTPGAAGECSPECDVTKNELCKETAGVFRCVCRPGFARIFQEKPCLPTYTYRMRLLLDSAHGEQLRYRPSLSDATSAEFQRLARESAEGVRRAAMRSELRDMFHGAAITGFAPAAEAGDTSDLTHAEDGVMVNFYVQLSENIEEQGLEDKFRQSLQTTNFSLGGTEVFAARETHLQASDFDECASAQFHDCAEHAQCFNLRGTYTCSCQDGFSDLSPSARFPGRVCSAEVLGCEQCSFHGTCYTLGRGDERPRCDCFQWYAGETCKINLKALLIALVTLGAVLLLLLLVCLILTCLKKRQHNKAGHAAGAGFMRYRGPAGAQVRGTLDKAAMLQETSSESSGDNSPLPYMTPIPSGSSKPRRGGKLEVASPGSEGGYVMEQDRSLTVMIPRAKYRPVQTAASVLSMSTFAAPAASSGPAEHKLLSYLESGNTEKSGSGGKRKVSSSSKPPTNHGEPPPSRKSSAPRKPSTGALVSAGFEVSAQVTRSALRGGQQQQAGGSKAPCEHLTLASHRSGFTTLRTGDSSSSQHLAVQHSSSAGSVAPMRAESVAPPPPPPPPQPPASAVTVSEARSYDETLVQPPTRSLIVRGHPSTYGSKPSSSRNDEGQTMAERDLGSTFLMPQSQLYKPTRGQGSDGSNFDSL